MAEAIGSKEFVGDGRGPELVRLCWSADGRTLLAAEYRNPSGASPWHVAFKDTQVVMITPEEVVGDVASLPNAGAYAVSLGRSPWLVSFQQTHLERCEHYRFVFYDETVDVICEGVRFQPGSFVEAVA